MQSASMYNLGRPNFYLELGLRLRIIPSLASCSLCLVMSKYLGDSGQKGSNDICKIEGKRAMPSR